MKTALVRCPVCGENKKVDPATARHIALGVQGENCGSCSTLLHYYSKEAVAEIHRLRRNGAASWSELKHLMELQGRDIEYQYDRNHVYRLCRRFGIKYQQKRNAESTLRDRRVWACYSRSCKVCERCGATEDVEAHHLVPIEYGGDTAGEMACLCHMCHWDAHREITARIEKEYGSMLAFKQSIFSQHSEEIAHLFA